MFLTEAIFHVRTVHEATTQDDKVQPSECQRICWTDFGWLPFNGRQHAQGFMPPNIKWSDGFDVLFLVMRILVGRFIDRLL